MNSEMQYFPGETVQDLVAAEVKTTKAGTLDYVPLSLRDKYVLQESYRHESLSEPTADLDWQPDIAKYQARTARRLATETLPQQVPKGWPQQVNSPLAWSGKSFAQDGEYLYCLSDEDKSEIDAALKHFKALMLEPQDINRGTFPLPGLCSRLRQLSKQLHYGRGFIIIRGLDPSSMSGEDNSLIYLGISAYIASERGRQDQDASMIVHLMDASHRSANKEKVQSVYTNLAQPFHSDVFCDILGLQTRACAAEGGTSIMASAWTVYNELAANRPDLIHTLAASDWTFDTFGRNPAYHQRPLLFHHASRLILNFSRRLLTGSPQSPRTRNIPPLTEAQAEALDAVHFAARDHAIAIAMRPGDLRYINNHAILHCRDAFRDSDATKRHLVRLWLRDGEFGWPIPEGLGLASARVFGRLEGVDERWDLDPLLDDGIMLNAKRSCGQG